MARTRTNTKAAPLPRHASLPATLLEKYKDFPGIKLIERRLLTGDEAGSIDIRLKGEPSHLEDPRGTKRIWYVRWINTKWPGRWAHVTQALGYVPVRVSELLDPEMISGLHRHDKDGSDPYVRIGDKGEEVLVKYPLELYTATKRAKQALRDRRARNAKIVKEELANTAGRSLGDEAADTIYDEFDLTLSRRKAKLGDEVGEADDAEAAEILDRA